MNNTKEFVKLNILPGEIKHIDEVVEIYTKKLLENIKDSNNIDEAIYYTLPNVFENFVDTGDAFCTSVPNEIKDQKLAEELVDAIKKDKIEITLTPLHDVCEQSGSDDEQSHLNKKVIERKYLHRK